MGFFDQGQVFLSLLFILILIFHQIRCHSSTKDGARKVSDFQLSLLPPSQYESEGPSRKPPQKMQGSPLRVRRIQGKYHSIQTHNQFPCLPYERTLTQCLNNYGVQGSYQVPECQQMALYFNECLSINQYFATLKKWNP